MRLLDFSGSGASVSACPRSERWAYEAVPDGKEGWDQRIETTESLAEIPAEATQAFIADHIDEQQAVNRLIAFANAECGVAERR